MKSIQTKFMFIIASAIVIASLLIGGLSVIYIGNQKDKDTLEIMNSQCNTESLFFNNIFSDIEHSATILGNYAVEKIDDVSKLKDKPFYTEYETRLTDLAMSLGNTMDESMAAYVRFNPEYSTSTAGFFLTKDNPTGELVSVPPTDLDDYKKDDRNHVGWYYEPIENGSPMWIRPYTNENIGEGVYMVSYVVPLYKNDKLLGIAGFDINFDIFTDRIDSIDSNMKGFAFLLESDFTLAYREGKKDKIGSTLEEVGLGGLATDIEEKAGKKEIINYKYEGKRYQAISKKLDNGMYLVLSLGKREVVRSKNIMILQMIGVSLAIASIFICFTAYYTKKYIKPLKELTKASEELAKGNLDVTVKYVGSDEIGVLSDSFRETVRELRTNNDYMKGLAYKDSMTGLNNKRAYDDRIILLENDIENNNAEFAIIFFDVDGLKRINDEFGHEMGDLLIINASRSLTETFKTSPIYRIGGDEFVVILQNNDYISRNELLIEFEKNVDLLNAYEESMPIKLSISFGMSTFDIDKDKSFNEVLERADSKMYECKAKNKKEQKNR